MPKVTYDNIVFDSQLEVEYYKYLVNNEKILFFKYHPKVPIQINVKSTYTPDFIVNYDDRVEIIETKGFNQFSYQRDSIVHNVMLEKTEDELKEYLLANDFYFEKSKKVIYKKIKYLKTFGWVDFDFKNPNTLAKKRREKITLLEAEIKELKAFKKDVIKYFNFLQKAKITKNQKQWLDNYLAKMTRGEE